MNRKTVFRNLAIVAGILLVIYAFSYFGDDTRGFTQVDTSVAVSQLESQNVSEARIDDREQQVRLWLENGNDATEGSTEIIAKYPASASEQIFDLVAASGAQKYDTSVTQESWLTSILIFVLPMIILLGVFFFVMSRMQGGGRGGMMGFGKSKAKQLSKDMPKTTFADVAGANEAVEELYEIKDFLQNPARYQALGAKIPKGVLLYGPPGTGKTLLARAVAGEAGVPFFTISGSDFVEMFVGVGASRVRDLFEQAKQSAPCIIFVDEIDAVGRQRGAGLGGGHDEREQTLNQLLVEMDGFGDRSGIIVMAATNRPDILDPALLRPGRFDRQIPVTNPDLAGRRAILAVHSKGKPIDPNADLGALAKRTVGMSGADLANVVNEAALLTARENGTVITEAILEESVDRVIGGPRRKSRIISEHEKKITAYHEGGHTLAAWAMPDIEPVYKVTILARGRTGGHAMTVPEDDKGLMTRSEMIARLVMAMGGRAAEELVFREPTTGASSDIDQATKIARAMVTEYGMSAKLGAVRYGQEQGDPFLGRSMGVQSDYSHEVAREIDEEVRNLIEAAHTEAWAILNEYRDALDVLASELLEHETLTRKDLDRILADVKKRPRITTFNDFGDRVPSDKPPIKTPAELAAERGEPWPPEPPSLTKPAHQHPQYPGQGEVPAPAVYQPGAQPQYQPANGYPQPQQQSQPQPQQQSQPVPASEPLPGFQPTAPYPGGPRHATRPDYGAPAGWSAPGWPPREQTPQEQQGYGQPQAPGQPQGYGYPQGPQGQNPQSYGQPQETQSFGRPQEPQDPDRPSDSGDNGAADAHRGENHVGDSQPRDGYGAPEPPPTQRWEGPAGRH